MEQAIVYLKISCTILLVVLLLVRLLKTVPARVKFRLCILSLCSMCMPWFLIEIPSNEIYFDDSELVQQAWSLRFDNEFSVQGVPARLGNAAAEPTEFPIVSQEHVRQEKEYRFSVSTAIRDHLEWLIGLLFFVGLLLLLFDIISYRQFIRRLRRDSTPANDLLDTFGCHLDRPFEIRRTKENTPGMATGLFGYTIWIGQGEENITLILQHELNHVLHKDPSWLWFITVIQRLFWWNPLVYFTTRSARFYIELSCDERCAENLSTERYATGLLDTMKVESEACHGAITGISINKRFNIKRIEELMKKKCLRARHIVIMLLCLSVTSYVSLSFANKNAANNEYANMLAALENIKLELKVEAEKALENSNPRILANLIYDLTELKHTTEARYLIQQWKKNFPDQVFSESNSQAQDSNAAILFRAELYIVIVDGALAEIQKLVDYYYPNIGLDKLPHSVVTSLMLSQAALGRVEESVVQLRQLIGEGDMAYQMNPLLQLGIIDIYDQAGNCKRALEEIDIFKKQRRDIRRQFIIDKFDGVEKKCKSNHHVENKSQDAKKINLDVERITYQVEGSRYSFIHENAEYIDTLAAIENINPYLKDEAEKALKNPSAKFLANLVYHVAALKHTTEARYLVRQWKQNFPKQIFARSRPGSQRSALNSEVLFQVELFIVSIDATYEETQELVDYYYPNTTIDELPLNVVKPLMFSQAALGKVDDSVLQLNKLIASNEKSPKEKANFQFTVIEVYDRVGDCKKALEEIDVFRKQDNDGKSKGGLANGVRDRYQWSRYNKINLERIETKCDSSKSITNKNQGVKKIRINSRYHTYSGVEGSRYSVERFKFKRNTRVKLSMLDSYSDHLEKLYQSKEYSQIIRKLKSYLGGHGESISNEQLFYHYKMMLGILRSLGDSQEYLSIAKRILVLPNLKAGDKQRVWHIAYRAAAIEKEYDLAISYLDELEKSNGKKSTHVMGLRIAVYGSAQQYDKQNAASLELIRMLRKNGKAPRLIEIIRLAETFLHLNKPKEAINVYEEAFKEFGNEYYKEKAEGITKQLEQGKSPKLRGSNYLTAWKRSRNVR